MKYRDILGFPKLKKKSIKEISSKVKKEIINIMKYDHIDDLADYIEQFDIDKKHWKVIGHYFDAIRDEDMGVKPEGWADRSRKELQKLLLKVIKEQSKPKSKKNMIVEGIKHELNEFKIQTFKDNPPFKTSKKLNEVGNAQVHKKYTMKIEDATGNLEASVENYSKFLIQQGHKKEAQELRGKFSFVGKFTHYMKTQWVRLLRNLI